MFTVASMDMLASEARDRSHSLANWRGGILKDALCIGFLWLLCLFFFWRLVTPDSGSRMVIAPGDYTNQFFPYQAFAASELHQGRVPLWNPFVAAGHPTAADTQNSVAYPVGEAINYALGGGGLPLLAVEWRSIIHYLLAILFSFMFVRSLTGKRFGAAVAAIVFGLGGYLLSYPGQSASILETAVWLPLIFLFILRSKLSISARAGKGRGYFELSLAGATLGIAFLAGHPQTAMFMFYGGLAYLFYSTHQAGWPWRNVLVGVCCYCAACFGIAAIQLFPTLEIMSLTGMRNLPYGLVAAGYQINSTLGIILPGWRNENALYIGIAPLALALLACIHRVKGTGFWIAMAAGSLLVSLGKQTPIFPVLYWAVPGLSTFHDQQRVAVLFVFSLAILAAYGADLISQAQRGSMLAQARNLFPPFLLIGAFALIPFFTTEWRTSTAFRPGEYGGLFSGFEIFLILVVLSMIVIWSGARWPRRIPYFAHYAMLIGLIVADSFFFNWHDNIVPAREPLPSANASATLDYLGTQPGLFRIRIGEDSILPSNFPGIYGIAHAGLDSPIRVKTTDDLLTAGPEFEWRLWQLFNVEYVVVRKPLEGGVALAYQSGDIRTYKVSYGLPRAYAVTNFRVAANASETLRQTLANDHNPGDLVVLEEAPSFDPSSMATRRPDVEIMEYSPQKMVIQADAEGNAILVVSETNYPGWKAYIDGKPTKIYAANYAFRGVELPLGKHTIEMIYEPLAFRLGAALSTLTLLAICGFAAVVALRRAR